MLHDLNLAARFGDEVLTMKDGTIAALGKTEDVLNPTVIELTYGLQVEMFKSPGKQRTVVIPS